MSDPIDYRVSGDPKDAVIQALMAEVERLRARIKALEAEVERLTNKLNQDSQNFQIECQKAELKLLRARIPDPNDLRDAYTCLVWMLAQEDPDVTGLDGASADRLRATLEVKDE